MNNRKAQDVFIPGALPESTYITRKAKMNFTYEDRLKQALSINGYLTFISGPSKIGKTVLCEKVIGLENLVEVSGSDFREENQLWIEIGKRAGMPYKGAFFNKNTDNTSMKETYEISKESVIAYYREHEKVLLLDDFHYADLEMQRYMAQQLKDAIRKGLKVIIASLPHRSDDSIRNNPDLQGRVSIIDMETWSAEELMQIPKAGFKELGIRIAEPVIEELASECICSPQLMQLICLNICILEKVDTGNITEIKQDILKQAFQFSTLNCNYEQAAKVIKQGKNSRGMERRKYKTQNYGELDLYGLILESIAIDPPSSKIDSSQLANRINALLAEGEEKPTSKSQKDYLANLQEVLNLQERSCQVIEWKDNVLYIMDPMFLFYLRWGRQ
ncbi:ATP-binding protein [Anaerosporobacter sp.]|uniref:ATP-binding protein n=1 Tax=Anaerosporobacter sp. TaxID=1872529 RepID=UPI00286EF7D6|nr:ATP-binding protein [Anaerosporobacter sp.]